MAPIVAFVRAGRFDQGIERKSAFLAALFGVDEAAAVRESTSIRDVMAADWDAQLLIEWRIGRGCPR